MSEGQSREPQPSELTKFLQRYWKWIAVITLAAGFGPAFMFWLGSALGFGFPFWDSLSAAGQFGDSFGWLNAIVSACGFLAVVLTISLQTDQLRIQSEQLRIQSEQLELQRKELRHVEVQLEASQTESMRAYTLQFQTAFLTALDSMRLAGERQIERAEKNNRELPRLRGEVHFRLAIMGIRGLYNHYRTSRHDPENSPLPNGCLPVAGAPLWVLHELFGLHDRINSLLRTFTGDERSTRLRSHRAHVEEVGGYAKVALLHDFDSLVTLCETKASEEAIDDARRKLKAQIVNAIKASPLFREEDQERASADS